jgi:hypothetical protein
MPSESEILQGVLRHYRERSGLPADAVHLAIEPLAPPMIPKGGGYWLTVAPGASHFPHDEVHDAVTMRQILDLHVTGYVRMRLDRPDRETSLILDPDRGVGKIKRLILTLSHVVIYDESDLPINVTISPVGASAPSYDPEQGIGWLSVQFAAEFDCCLPS